MNLLIRRIAPLFLIVGLLTGGGAAAGDKAPKLSARDLGGREAHLSDYEDSLVVLNFWATWCPPCKAEMPLLWQAHRDYASRGVAFIGVSLDDRDARKVVAGFVRKNRVKYDNWIGVTPDVLTRFGMGQSIPATAFLDREGRVLFRILGQMRENEIQERLDWLLGDRLNPSPAALVTHLGATP